jgi:hypothetical protein
MFGVRFMVRVAQEVELGVKAVLTAVVVAKVFPVAVERMAQVLPQF